MQRPAALSIALSLVEQPSLVRLVGASFLPEGVILLLAVAAAQSDALRLAQEKTGRSEAALRLAAGFFIEQVLFSQDSDSYRILGTSSQAPRSELRQHMGLLMKWLHPDRRELSEFPNCIDRSIFLHRVNKAWDDLKSNERRAAYDQALSRKSRDGTRGPARPAQASDKPRAGERPRRFLTDAKGAQQKRGPRRLAIVRFEREPWLSRLLRAWLRA